MLGPPGSGKGTQGQRLAARHHVPHVSSGELLRDHVRRQTPLGRAASHAMARGDLIDDELVISMIGEEVIRPDAPGGFVLDGFPRTVAQATAAYDIALRHGITLHAVVWLDIPRDELRARLQARGAAAARPDDNSATIGHRLDVYVAQTLPLVEFYTGRDILITIDGTGTVDQVAARIDTALDPVLRAGE